jgi:hypothetical protein
VDAGSVARVLNALGTRLRAGLAKGERVEIAGSGTFAKRPPAQEGKPERIIFRPAASKEERKARRKQKAGGTGYRNKEFADGHSCYKRKRSRDEHKPD